LNTQNIKQRDEQVRRKFEEEGRSRIVRLWLQNMNYRQIAQQTQASLGTISAEIEKARKAEPNLDSLRELNATLKKSGVGLLDAIKACSILLQLDELGVGVNQLSQYVELSKKLAGEHGVNPAELVESAIQLSRIEAETGKSRKDLLKEFEEKTTQLKELDNRVKTLRNELKQAQRQRDIAQLCEQMKATGLEPGRLKEFIHRRGPLERQLRSLEEEINQGKARLSILAKMEKDLQRRVEDIQRIELILQSRMSSFACPHCGGVTWREIRRFEVSQCLAMGQPIIVNCQRCGAPNTYNPYEVLARLGFEVLS
jgi:predicted RNA-binding Zn-ribbon protein involved in translation (DUF1610 family)